MPGFIAHNPHWRQPDDSLLNEEIDRATYPLQRSTGNVHALRDQLQDVMWDDVGILRDSSGLGRALSALDGLEADLMRAGVADSNRAFNLTWHDWLNMRSLVEISRVITMAARQRENSRGAHFREDFPGEGELETSRFTVARQTSGRVEVTDEPVRFSVVKPGDSILVETTEAAE